MDAATNLRLVPSPLLGPTSWGRLLDLDAVVLVDAALPTTSPTPLAPPPFLAFLRGLASDDGLLPPWTQWWGDLGDLFPSRGARRGRGGRASAAARLRHGHAAVPAGWTTRCPAAYLVFGDTYADEQARAREAGWPVRTLPGRHPHHLHDPAGVASAVRALLAAARGG